MKIFTFSIGIINARTVQITRVVFSRKNRPSDTDSRSTSKQFNTDKANSSRHQAGAYIKRPQLKRTYITPGNSELTGNDIVI